MATLHLMVGLPGSGKTTLAKQLEQSEHALRLTPDAWQIALTARQVYVPGTEHDELHTRIEHIMWEVAARVLTLGGNVILDFGFWAQEERDDFAARARALGADCVVNYVAAPLSELKRRLARRNAAADDTRFIIDPDCLDAWYAAFEAPTEDR